MHNRRIGDRESSKRVGISGPYAYTHKLPSGQLVEAVTNGHATPHPSQFRPDRATRTIEWTGKTWVEV